MLERAGLQLLQLTATADAWRAHMVRTAAAGNQPGSFGHVQLALGAAAPGLTAMDLMHDAPGERGDTVFSLHVKLCLPDSPVAGAVLAHSVKFRACRLVKLHACQQFLVCCSGDAAVSGRDLTVY